MSKPEKRPKGKQGAKKTATATKQVKGRVIDPVDLVIQETPSGIQLWSDGQPILLPNGKPLAHPRLTLVEHIREEFSGFGTVTLDGEGLVLKPDTISSYVLLGVQRSIEADPSHPFVTGFDKWLLLDPCLSHCAGPEVVDQMARWGPLFRFYESHGLSAPTFSQSPITVDETDDFEDVLKKRGGGGDDFELTEHDEGVRAFVRGVVAVFRRLGPEEWAAMCYLFGGHDSVLFPLLLVTGNCTAQEYANGLMAAHCFLAGVFADVAENDHETQTRLFREDAQIVLQFLEHARCPWAKEILKGEDDTREFKATLRYDLATEQHNTELEHSLLKNVAGFLNEKGGTIFVGVGDRGEIVGIELDRFESNDKWWLHLVNRIGQQIGKRFLPMCSIEFDTLHGKSVCRITVSPSDQPAFLDERALKMNGKKNAFFIRGGPSAQKLTPEDTEQHIAKRFPLPSTSSIQV